MWRYLKYFVPIILSIIVIISVFLFPLSGDVDLEEIYRVSITIGCVFFGAIWFLYQSKPSHKFTLHIAGAISLFVLPFIILIVDVDYNFYMTNLISDNDNFRTSYFSLVLICLIILYCLRFYAKDRQDIFSLLKLLLILTSLILTIILFFEVLDDAVLDNIGMTVLILTIFLTLLHIIDMIIWEKNRKVSPQKTNELEELIDQISGK